MGTRRLKPVRLGLACSPSTLSPRDPHDPLRWPFRNLILVTRALRPQILRRRKWLYVLDVEYPFLDEFNTSSLLCILFSSFLGPWPSYFCFGGYTSTHHSRSSSLLVIFIWIHVFYSSTIPDTINTEKQQEKLAILSSVPNRHCQYSRSKKNVLMNSGSLTISIFISQVIRFTSGVE